MPWLEAIAALISALAVWLTTRRHPSCWPVGLVSVALYAWVFFGERLYSDMLLQGVFAAALVYGWNRWLHHLDGDGLVRVAPLSPRRAILHITLGAFGALAWGLLMHRFTDAALPWLDAALAAFSLVAQWWGIRRHTAVWWMWIAVDLIYVGMYTYKSLFITAMLYGGFVLLAVAGLRSWQKAALTQRAAAPGGDPMRGDASVARDGIRHPPGHGGLVDETFGVLRIRQETHVAASEPAIAVARDPAVDGIPQRVGNQPGDPGQSPRPAK